MLIRTLLNSCLIAACTGLAACNSPRQPAPSPVAQQPPDAPAPAASPTPSEQVRFLDPETGEAREPTPEELATLLKSRAPVQGKPLATPQPTRIEKPDGTVILRYEEPPSQPLMGCRRSNGELLTSHDCAPDTRESQQ